MGDARLFVPLTDTAIAKQTGNWHLFGPSAEEKEKSVGGAIGCTWR